MNPYKKLFRAFDKEKVRYLIVGGVAVNLYGYNRTTGDIDVLLALEKNNLEKVAMIMDRLGYTERLPVGLKELRDKKKVKKWIKEKGMTAYTFISSKKPQLDLDILVDYSFSFKKYFDKRAFIEIWDMKVPVVSFNDLVSMKKKAGRDKDLLDVKALLELKTL
ncbi:MAG TPA: hypothetical protein DCY48_03825 [Candidatus Magasanikbacteria bacterium]|nr:hypothetical protein [Candidatus Magasanikbacteria bacterium]